MAKKSLPGPSKPKSSRTVTITLLAAVILSTAYLGSLVLNQIYAPPQTPTLPKLETNATIPTIPEPEPTPEPTPKPTPEPTPKPLKPREPWEKARGKGSLIMATNTLYSSDAMIVEGPYYTNLDNLEVNYTIVPMGEDGNEITIFFYAGNKTSFEGVISYNITQVIILPEELKQPMNTYSYPDSVQMYLGEPTNPKYATTTTFAKAIIENAKTQEEAINLIRDYTHDTAPREDVILEEYCLIYSQYGEAIYRAAGFPTRIIRGYLAPDEIGHENFRTQVSHAYLEVWSGGWIKVDPLNPQINTVRLIPYCVGDKVHRFNEPLKILSTESHIIGKRVWRISETEFRVEYVVSSP